MTKEEMLSILVKVQEDCEDSFRTLFNMYRQNIYTTSMRISNDSAFAEDVVQEVFLKVWMNRKALSEIQDFEKWIYVIAKNMALNLIKKRMNHTLYEKEFKKTATSHYFSTEYLIEDKEYQGILKQAVDRLPPKQKETYYLIKQQYLKRREVADLLNVTPDAVKWNLREALKNIRTYCLARINDIPFLVLHLLYFFIKFL